MKSQVLLTALIVFVLATIAYAECPDRVGTFSTMTDNMQGGRVSEAWCGGAPGQAGNTENAMSWNGTDLGAEWKAQGMSIISGAVEIARSLDADGNGWIEYRTDYENGTFWMSKDGAWGDGYQDLSGQILNYSVTTKVTYVMGNHVGSTSNIYFTGIFDGCPAYNGCMIEYAIANSMENRTADPSGYPPFICGDSGEFFDVCCITTSMSCVVSNEQASFSQIKTQYR